MSSVRIASLTKKFGEVEVLKGIDLHVAEGEFLTLLGPSGCGKTTTLRCLAGLETPTSGTITVGDRVFASPETSVFVPPEKRKVGMVFQNYALWPHMTVRGNVAYPLKLAKVPKEEISARVHEILQRIGLADREAQMAPSLSGGQQQRVALARALVSRPTLMLFDEPLSNLDAKLRYSMRNEIRSLHDAYGMTSVYVTHDQEEAIALSDRIVVMRSGRIEQIGSPRELYTRPANDFVADFMGFQNILRGEVTARRADGFTARVEGIDLELSGPAPGPEGTRLSVAFRAAHVEVEPDHASPGSRLHGTVLHETYLGSSSRMLIDVAGVRIRTELDEGDLNRLAGRLPEPGGTVTLALHPANLVALPHAGSSGRAADAPLASAG